MPTLTARAPGRIWVKETKTHVNAQYGTDDLAEFTNLSAGDAGEGPFR